MTITRRRFVQTTSLEERLAEQAKRLREEARGTPPGVARDDLIRKARHAEAAQHMQDWIKSSGLQPPK
jgi:hypothetical protein